MKCIKMAIAIATDFQLTIVSEKILIKNVNTTLSGI